MIGTEIELTPEEKNRLIYILEMKLKDYKETGEEFFEEAICNVTNILNKRKKSC